MKTFRKLSFLVCSCLLMASTTACRKAGQPTVQHEQDFSILKEKLNALTEDKPGTFGIAIITDRADTIVHNNVPDYPLMSLFKLQEALAVCHTLDKQGEGLEKTLTLYRKALDEHTWSPMLEDYPADSFTLTVKELLDYILVHSDNNASNILFDRIVSVAETDSIIRTLSPESAFRLRYKEAEMQTDITKSYANCSSPLAYAGLIRRLFTTQLVSDTKQKAITEAMGRCNTGMARIAAGLPLNEGVRLAHRTGSGYTNSRGEVIAINDGGYVCLPSGMTYTIVVLVKDYAGTQEEAESIMADISRTVYDYLAADTTSR